MARSVYTRSNRVDQARKATSEPRTLESLDAPEVEGLSLAHLRPMTRLRVRTRNTLYRLVVLAETRILVHGGEYFPLSAEVQLYASSTDGGPLKTHWLGVGFRMELSGPTEHIVTSPVHSIEVEGDSVHGPF